MMSNIHFVCSVSSHINIVGVCYLMTLFGRLIHKYGDKAAISSIDRTMLCYLRCHAIIIAIYTAAITTIAYNYYD